MKPRRANFDKRRWYFYLRYSDTPSVKHLHSNIYPKNTPDGSSIASIFPRPLKPKSHRDQIRPTNQILCLAEITDFDVELLIQHLRWSSMAKSWYWVTGWWLIIPFRDLHHISKQQPDILLVVRLGFLGLRFSQDEASPSVQVRSDCFKSFEMQTEASKSI
jgi:hypothetical protein